MKYNLTFFILFLSFSTLAEEPLLVVTELAPPNQVLIDGEVQGKGTQYIRDIFKQAGLTPDIQMYPWARAYKMVKVLADLNDTSPRAARPFYRFRALIKLPSFLYPLFIFIMRFLQLK